MKEKTGGKERTEFLDNWVIDKMTGISRVSRVSAWRLIDMLKSFGWVDTFDRTLFLFIKQQCVIWLFPLTLFQSTHQESHTFHVKYEKTSTSPRRVVPPLGKTTFTHYLFLKETVSFSRQPSVSDVVINQCHRRKTRVFANAFKCPRPSVPHESNHSRPQSVLHHAATGLI